MNLPQPVRIPEHLTAVLALARLFERIERSPQPVTPEQYRLVARRLGQLLAESPADAALQAVLDAFPATAELYENLNYQHAGLCRSPLEAALNAELQARALIGKMADAPKGRPERR